MKLALDFDKLAEAGLGNSEAYSEIQRRDDWYDPYVVEALKAALASESNYEVKSVKVDELTINMILAADVISSNGLLLIAKGQEVTASLCLRLGNFVRNKSIPESIKVLAPTRSGTNAKTHISTPDFTIALST